jgi:hypothetical protein
MKIKVNVVAVDGYRAYRTFDNLEAARRFAHRRAGEAPEVSVAFDYAVAADGVLKVTVGGDATLADVFPRSFDYLRDEDEAKEDCSRWCESWFRNGAIACEFCPKGGLASLCDDEADYALDVAAATHEMEPAPDPDDIPF